ncbi:PAS domain-containing protein [Polyangium aurulentum]|uniref:PAS domain-containing protein n=1 Tax=Polyangium aurulentum TaxID=2567896 RepID=UPI0010ADB13A|nr:PAS domain-containing protein [Polyangium aurulentum]UQA60685.1 PAS domain-containing protein [Polyangium aurulentum]
MNEMITLLDEVSDLVCLADADGKIAFLNKAARRLVGIGASEDAAGRRLLELFPEHERPQIEAEALPSVQREGAWRGRSALATIDGRHVPVAAAFLRHSAASGEHAQLLVTMQPVEDAVVRARLENLLAKSRVVFYSSKAYGDYSVTYMSANVHAQLGYPAEHFLRDPGFWADHIHPEDAPRVLGELASIAEQQHQTHEYRFLCADGKYQWVYDEAVCVKDESGNPVELVGTWQDVTERKEAELLIQEQAAALMQFSTPLVPISDDVLVMPIVGALDAQRAEQVMTTLLDGVSKGQARVAILDITGVSVVDTQVADALLRAAKAVALLGAQVVITGIRSEVAQTLVQLGANMGDVVTRATLQAGVAFAMQGRAAGRAGALRG